MRGLIGPPGRSGGCGLDKSGKNALQNSAEPRRVSRNVQSPASWLSSAVISIFRSVFIGEAREAVLTFAGASRAARSVR